MKSFVRRKGYSIFGFRVKILEVSVRFLFFLENPTTSRRLEAFSQKNNRHILIHQTCLTLKKWMDFQYFSQK